MDIIIALALVLIALSMLLGKPLTLKIEHKYNTEQPVTETPKTEDAQKQLDEQEPLNLDGVLKAIHEVMGVSADAE